MCADCIDHPSQARPGIHVFPDRLHVVTMLENPLRWRSRYWNYWMFERECEAAGAILYTAEVAFGERHFEVTQAGNPRHLQLRTIERNLAQGECAEPADSAVAGGGEVRGVD